MILKSLLLFSLLFQPISPEDLEDVDEAGSYQVMVTVEVNGETITQPTTLIITLPKTVIRSKEGIDAHDFTTTIETVKRGDAQELIRLAGAHAWSLDDGSDVPIVHITIKNETISNGLYEIIFTTKQGTEIQIFALTQSALNLEKEVTYVYPKAFWGKYTQMEVAIKVLSTMMIPVAVLVLVFTLIFFEVKKIKKLLYSKVNRRQ